MKLSSIKVGITLALIQVIMLCHNLTSQNKVIDSLENKLKTSVDDSLKVKLLDDLSWEYIKTDLQKSIEYTQQQLDLSSKINYKKGSGMANFNLGAINYMQAKYSSAIDNFRKSFEFKKGLRDFAGAAGVLNNIAMSYQQLGTYPEAIANYLKAIKIFEELKDEKRLTTTNNNISALYIELKNYNEALKFCLKALQVYERNKDRANMSSSYINMGNIYNLQKQNDKALAYYFKTLEIEKDIQNKYNLSRAFNNIGTIYMNQKEYSEAETYFNKSAAIKDDLDDKEGLTSAYYSLGSLNEKTGNFAQAIDYYQRAIKLSKEIGYKDGIKWGYYGLKNTYVAQNKFEEAINYYTLYEQLKDTLFSEDNNRKIAEMQTKYETATKEKENLELKRKTEIQELQITNENQKRKNQLLISLGCTILIVATILFLYNRRKLKQKAEYLNEIARAEKQRFKDVIEAEEKERSRIAQELHDGLGQMLSAARLNVAGFEDSVSDEDKVGFQKSLKIIDNACVEVRNISHNMMPSALIRLGLVAAINEVADHINSSKTLKVSFKTNLTASLGQANDITVYRIVQEILNNMIKHSKAKVIEMEINKGINDLMININDNGIGFDTAILKVSEGMGWKNIFSRVSLMNGNIEIDSVPQKGTKVFINLKLNDE